MSGERRPYLDMPDFDNLDDFDTPPVKSTPVTVKQTESEKSKKSSGQYTMRRKRAALDRTSSFPSREVSEIGQINIAARNDVLDRFRALCKADRRKQGDMLEILMDKANLDVR